MTELPKLISPCLHDIPVHDTSHEISPYPRHVQFLADPATADVIRARSVLTQYLRQFFLDRMFMEVNTPVIESVAGGAIARPFSTSATEFPKRKLSLRIAPELWLKRLVVGGFDKVFEIGPSFRNEGMSSQRECHGARMGFAQVGIDRNHRLGQDTQPRIHYL